MLTLLEIGGNLKVLEVNEMDDKEKWKQTIEKETQSLKENYTYDLVKLLKRNKTSTCRRLLERQV